LNQLSYLATFESNLVLHLSFAERNDTMLNKAEYIWLDGAQPTQQLRSKTKILSSLGETPKISDFPKWSYDGSSTYQSEGRDSDLELNPVNFVLDPIRGKGNFLVLCEVMNVDGSPHRTNTRAKLRRVLDQGGADADPWVGFEQEYTLFRGNRPLGWPSGGYPPPQGPFYCGVGSNQVYGRDFVEAHTKACMDAGILLYGINAEVMPAQWEFQVGYRGIEGENAGILNVSDHHWLARWLLFRVAEDFNVEPSLDNKPVKGDWNGAGQHTNFSTTAMRNPETGMGAIEEAIVCLGEKHDEHIAFYGAGLEERLTGLHETCKLTEFRAGVADRGASIRIPRTVSQNGCGYIEDRRPGANADPYVISTCLVKTVCKIA